MNIIVRKPTTCFDAFLFEDTPSKSKSAEIETEQQAVDACKTLITRQAKKIKEKIEEVWGGA